MLYLVLSVVFSTLIFIVFKLYPVYKVQTLYAIIINYFVASAVGIWYYDGVINLSDIFSKTMVFLTLALGVLFIIVFNLMAKTSQTVGVSVASVATKMSLVIPVLVGVVLYKEHLSLLKWVGILMALLAVYFTSLKSSKTTFNKEMLIWPLLVFIGSGVIDTSLKFFETTLVAKEELPLFSAVVFGAAGITGVCFILIRAFKTPLKINNRNILGGIVLGVPNFFSIYFLLKSLGVENMDSAAVFTINNVAIVMLTTILGIVLFKEHMSSKNWIGIGLAVISISLVALF